MSSFDVPIGEVMTKEHLITAPQGITLEEAKEICEKGITSSELEMYREDGSIYRKRLGVSPDKLQIVKI